MKPKQPSEKQVALYEQATQLRRAGKYKESELLYLKLFKALPHDPQILAGYAITAFQLGHFSKSVKLLEKCLKISPNQPNAWSNLGNAWAKLLNFDKAMHCYEQAIALNPNHAVAECNRGLILQELHQIEAALASFNRAIEIKPDYAEAYWSKGVLKLLTGDYQEGWQLYEWRWQTELKNQIRVFNQPLWLGIESLKDKTILIYAEQGYGDFIQFCRYIPLLQALGAKVIIETPPQLISLISTLKAGFTPIDLGIHFSDFDFQCPIMSLPLAFNTRLNSIPKNIPYLFPNNEKQQYWQEQLGQQTQLRIGIAWSGSTMHKHDFKRSMSLEILEPLLQLPFEFHCLQKEISSTDLRRLTQRKLLLTHCDKISNFSDTAALIANLDLIITVDTSVAHLAGALGKPVWILLPFSPDFRWMLNVSDTPWYSSATLFRQTVAGDWTSVIAKVMHQLEINFIVARL